MATFWTSRAWSDSHSDLFVRNILTGLGFGDDTAARTYAEFTANNERPTWPAIDEVMRWDAQNSYPGVAGATATPAAEALQLALDAAIERVADRCHLLVRPVDANGAVDPTGEAVEVPAAVKLATIMLAVRWARRRTTPDGIAGSSEISGLIRTSSIDPDIEAMLAPHLALGLA